MEKWISGTFFNSWYMGLFLTAHIQLPILVLLQKLLVREDRAKQYQKYTPIYQCRSNTNIIIGLVWISRKTNHSVSCQGRVKHFLHKTQLLSYNNNFSIHRLRIHRTWSIRNVLKVGVREAWMWECSCLKVVLGIFGLLGLSVFYEKGGKAPWITVLDS